MTLSQLRENVVKLFLRLNGYVTTGLIIHSDEHGKNKTEIDVIAIRFPFHSQEDREVLKSEYLEIPSLTIDIILAEVKGGKNEKNQFNSALWADEDALKKLINWIGFIPKERTTETVKWLSQELKPKSINKLENFPELIVDNTYSVRPIVFNLDYSAPKNNQKRIVYGELVLNYIWECFRPEKKRDKCSTSYPINLWGSELESLVDYFKNKQRTKPGTMKDLYKHFGFAN